MRFLGLALTMAVLLALGAMPATAQQNGTPRQKTKTVDLGDAFTNWMKSDDKGNSVANATSASTSSTAPSGGGFSGFISGLLPSKGGPAAGTGPATLTVEGTARADDANILDITKADGSVLKVRQWGIEAPETKQWPWGPRARGELDRILAASAGKVKCTSDGSTTKSGNLVARCFAGETDISAKLIEGGYGVEWREMSGGAYTQLEKTAQAGQLGVWEKR